MNLTSIALKSRFSLLCHSIAECIKHVLSYLDRELSKRGLQIYIRI